jgi:hypothetical protein
MEVPDILKGEPHLPLTPSMTLSEALPLVNMFYQTTLSSVDFSESQVFEGPDGLLILEARSAETGEVLIRFVNQNINVPQVARRLTLTNPLAADTKWLAPFVVVDDPSELAFLDELGSGNTYSTLSDNTLAWKLATLLNEYHVAGHWRASTFADYSAAGFELVYKGPSGEETDEYLIGDSDMVAVLRFHHGVNKGMLCLKS